MLKCAQFPDAPSIYRDLDMPHNFWMINCNNHNFDITQDMGFSQQGLKAEYRRKVQRVEPGDRIIYYVSGQRVFTATATVTRGYEEVRSTPWVKEGKTTWPYLIHIKPDVVLNREQYIDAGLIAYRLEYLRKWPPEDWHMAFQGNLHLLSKGDFFLLETEMMKLKHGREEALRRADVEIAAETERVNAQRERRRRNAERDTARAPRPRNEPAPEAAERKTDEPSAANEEATAVTRDQSPPGRNRPNGRGRRPQSRGRNRQTAPNTPKFDDD
ncbi:MAG: EVE domain-containing protein [Chloroflexi bacterium]|nr:EVE domain-containing protein [Chloroflexota bacterium]